MMFSSFFHRQEIRIPGEVVDLVEEGKHQPSSYNDFATTIQYGIHLHNTYTKVGKCDLRVGKNEALYYAGNIGYHIQTPYRGNHYAFEACLILFQIAKNDYHMEELIITCSPENIASKKTCQKLGGNLIETTPVPEDHWLYKRGEPTKHIFLYHL